MIKTDLNVQNRQRLIDLEKEKETQKEIITQTEKQIKLLTESSDFIRPEAYQVIGDRQAKQRKTKQSRNRK